MGHKVTLLTKEGQNLLEVNPGESLRFKQTGIDGFGIQGVIWWEDIEPPLMSHIEALQQTLEAQAGYSEVTGKAWAVWHKIPAEEFGYATPFTKEGAIPPHRCASSSIKIPLQGIDLEVIPGESVTFKATEGAGRGMEGVLFWDTFEPGLRAALERLTVETQGISEDRAALYIGWNTWAAEAGKMLFTLQETEADHKVA